MTYPILAKNKGHMKTLGLVGGISWVSTVDYYRYINEGINERLGGLNFAQCIIYSFNYAEVIQYNSSGNTEGMLKRLVEICQNLYRSGAEGILLCANTAHRFAYELQAQLDIPLIHIADATADAMVAQKITKAGLLGTKFTMELDFMKDKYRGRGVDILIPEEEDRVFIHHTLHEELGKGIIKPATKTRYLEIINKLVAQGAEGIISGCTEIPLLLGQEDCSIPLFDTAKLHAAAAVNFALG